MCLMIDAECLRSARPGSAASAPDTSARPMASCCCCPPEGIRRRAARTGLQHREQRRDPAWGSTAAALGAPSPSRRFSSTVRREDTRGPAARSRCPAGPRAPGRLIGRSPSKVIAPAVAAWQAHDAFEERGLADAVAAHQARARPRGDVRATSRSGPAPRVDLDRWRSTRSMLSVPNRPRPPARFARPGRSLPSASTEPSCRHVTFTPELAHEGHVVLDDDDSAVRD